MESTLQKLSPEGRKADEEEGKLREKLEKKVAYVYSYVNKYIIYHNNHIIIQT
jgi:hypothetical protein